MGAMKNLSRAARLRAEAAEATREATELLQRASELIQSGKTSEAMGLKQQAEEKQIKSRRLIERANHLAE